MKTTLRIFPWRELVGVLTATFLVGLCACELIEGTSSTDIPTPTLPSISEQITSDVPIDSDESMEISFESQLPKPSDTASETTASNPPGIVSSSNKGNENYEFSDQSNNTTIMETGTATLNNELALGAYKAVLIDDSKMLDAYVGQYTTLKEYIDISDAEGVFVNAFTKIDLDEDDTDELILEICKGNDPGDMIESLILHYHEGIVYCYSLSARTFNDLKSNGTFWYSGGAADSGFGRISFTDKDYIISKITYCDSHADSDGGIMYFVDQKNATSEEFDRAVNQWREIQNTSWYEFTDENIEIKLK